MAIKIRKSAEKGKTQPPKASPSSSPPASAPPASSLNGAESSSTGTQIELVSAQPHAKADAGDTSSHGPSSTSPPVEPTVEVLSGGISKTGRPIPPIGGDSLFGDTEAPKAPMTAESWLQDNFNMLVYGAIAIIFMVAAYSGYSYFANTAVQEDSTKLTNILKNYDRWSAQETKNAFQQVIFPREEDQKVPAYYNTAAERGKEMLGAAETEISSIGEGPVLGKITLLAASAAFESGDHAKSASLAKSAQGLLEREKLFALQLQATAMLAQGDTKGAISIYEQIELLSPADYGIFALREIAAIQEQVGEPMLAAASYKKLLNEYPLNLSLGPRIRHRLTLLVEDVDAYLAPKATPTL